MPTDDKRQRLIKTVSRTVAYAAPVLVAVAGYAAADAIYSDVARPQQGYNMAATGEAEGESEAKPEGEAEAEAESEAKPEGEAEGEAEAP
jgi:hypothetical protein